MSMTEKSIQEALNRFECASDLDYPQFDEMFLIETHPDGIDEPKEDAQALALYNQALYLTFGGPSIRNWLSRPLKDKEKHSHPYSGKVFAGKVPTPRPAKELFALTLAAAIEGGHLQALKDNRDDANLQALLDRKECEDIIELGNDILKRLKAAPGDTLREKIQSLNLNELKGTMGEINFLTKFVHLDLNKAESNAKSQIQPKPLDAELADIEKIDIHAVRPSIEVQRTRKARDLAEIAAPEYVGLGYPLERNLKGKPSSPNERIAMRAIKDIYDPKLLLELLQEVLALARVDKNVACVTSALQSKILYAYLKEECGVEEVYAAIDSLIPVLDKVPAWSKIKEDSLRPYAQAVEQFVSGIMKEDVDETKWISYFLALHKFKIEMLNIHVTLPEAALVSGKKGV